jgi:hypothetical protein
MENLQTVGQTVREGGWLTKIDLKDAYLAIPVTRAHRKFLRFNWGGETFEFTCLPFGLSSPPWAFTKCLRPVVAFLRSKGIRLIIYLDDILMAHSSKVKAKEKAQIVISLLESLGFIISIEKSILDPTHSLEYIGLYIHTSPMTFTLPEKKVAGILKLCESALKRHEISLRELASIIGKLNWAISAVRYARAHFRSLQALYIESLKEAQGDLQTIVSITEDNKNDIAWWINQANFKQGKPILISATDMSISTGASLSGWGPSIKASGQEDRGHWQNQDAT